MAENTGRRRVNPKTRLQRWMDSMKKLKGALTTSLVFSIIIHIAMIVIGALNIHKCPASSNIPIFLIVEGAIGILSKMLSLTRNVLLRYFRVDPILSTIGLIEFAFFICGSVWVFGALAPKYDPAFGDLYCNKTTYLFSLTIICCIYIIIAVVVLIFFCIAVTICLTVALCNRGDHDDKDAEVPPERTPLPTKYEC